MRTSGPIALEALTAAALLASAAARAGDSPAQGSSGPVSVSASGLEYRRFDPRTGVLAMTVSAGRASAEGEEATLEEVRFARYSPGGAPVLEAAAPAGRMCRGLVVLLEGTVAVAWRGAGMVATFRAEGARWDGAAGVLTSEGAVEGAVRGVAERGRDAPAAGGARAGSGHPPAEGASPKGGPSPATAGFCVEFEGTGLEVVPARDSGRIVRDVVAVASGVSRGPWRATADGGLGIAGLSGGSPALELAGPVGIDSHAARASADAAGLELEAADGGRLSVSRAWLTGTVHARIETGSALPWGEGPVEIRAEAAEIAPADGGSRGIVLGTESDPARVAFPRGVLRGTRVELSSEAVRSDGGARSDFEWGAGR